jgi:hypothetical protein
MSAALRWFRIPWPAAAVSIAVPLLLLLAVDLVLLDLAPGERFTGYFREDLLYYSANAREVFENGNGLVYGDPFSASFDTPRVFSHLQLLLLAWAWRLSGVELPWLWQAAQLVFGFSMFVALYRLLECFFERQRLGYAFAVCALGGGATWLEALRRSSAEGEPLSYLRHFDLLVGGPAAPGWLPNVFQNALLPTEAFYHTLAFATFAAVLRGRHAWALLGVFLVWWSHPFTGLEVAAIVGTFATVEVALRRERRMVAFAAGVAAISGAFLAYYVLLLPSWSPEAADILLRWRRAALVFHFAEAPLMWGLFVAGPLFVMAPALRPLKLSVESSDRFLAVWIVVVAALLLHDLVLPSGVYPYQPIHFSHGYFFLPIAILTLRGVIRIAADWRPGQRAIAALAFLIVVTIDNASFLTMVAASKRKPVLEPGVVSVVDYLSDQESPALVLIGEKLPFLREYLPVATPHRVYNFSRLQTPYFEDKMLAVERMMASRSPAQAGALIGLSWVVVAGSPTGFESDIERGRARLALRSGHVRLVEILLPPVPQRPGRAASLP